MNKDIRGKNEYSIISIYVGASTLKQVLYKVHRIQLSQHMYGLVITKSVQVDHVNLVAPILLLR
jgi:hypothetical protein